MVRHISATTQPPGVPKVECVRAFLFRASAPRSVPTGVAQHVSALHSPQEFPRWRVHVHSCSVPALLGVSQGGAACLRTQEYPKVAQHASALHSPQEFPRWRVHVHSWLFCHFSLVAAHALTHARADLLARACTRIRARLRMHTCGHTPTSAEKAPGPRTPRARRRCPTRSPIAPLPLAMARTCTRFPAAERRQQHARRKDKARRLTQVPWAESRRPLAQTTALPPRMGPERPILAMTVKVFFSL